MTFLRVLPGSTSALLTGLTVVGLALIPPTQAQDPAGVVVPPQPLPIDTSLPAGVQGQGTCLVSPQGDEPSEAIFSTRPVFVWRGAVISRIELTDLTAGELAWAGNPELPVPQVVYHSTPLTPGHEYRWTLFGQTGAELGSASFRIMSAEQRAPIETALDTLQTSLTEQGKTPGQINVAVVNYFSAQGLWSDAVTAAVNASPPSPQLGRFVRDTRNLLCGNPSAL